MPTIGENVRRLREAAGYATQKAFADALEVPPPRVNDWENDRYGLPDTATLLKIAKALRCSIDDLLAGVDPRYDAGARPSIQLMRADDGPDAEEVDFDVATGYKPDDIPVIAEGEASPQPDLFWDDTGMLKSDVEERISRPFDVRDPRAYAVKVRGDSMVPRFNPGEVLVISPNTPVEDGDEVYVALLSGERLLKIARKVASGWILESKNPAYPARLVKRAEIGTMHPVMWIRPKRRGKSVVGDGGRRLPLKDPHNP